MGILLSLLISGLLTTSVYAIMAMGFTVIYNTTKEFHIAHGGVFTAGSYMMFVAFKQLGMNIWLSLILAVIVSILLGLLVNQVIYQPLRNRSAALLVIFVSSLGLFTVLQYLLILMFGNAPQPLPRNFLDETVELLPGVVTTWLGILAFVLAILVLIGVILFYKHTKTGWTLRAVASSADLARCAGLKVERSYAVAYAIGSGLAGLGGALIAIQAGANPFEGLSVVLVAIIATLMGGGGHGNLIGPFIAAFLLGLIQAGAVIAIPSNWTQALAFALFLIFVLLRPSGIFGGARRAERV